MPTRRNGDRPRAGTGNPLHPKKRRLKGIVAKRIPVDQYEVPWWRAFKENA